MHNIFTAQIIRQTKPYLYIGKVAEITGASRKAIRYYEALGLLPAPQRRGKYRIYSKQDTFLIHMIKYAQMCGFCLAELKELVSATVESNEFPLRLANSQIERKQASLRVEIGELQKLEQHLVDIKIEMNRIFSLESSSLIS
jgi:MerR family transcriptional regulator, copper efflux regulator